MAVFSPEQSLQAAVADKNTLTWNWMLLRFIAVSEITDINILISAEFLLSGLVAGQWEI